LPESTFPISKPASHQFDNRGKIESEGTLEIALHSADQTYKLRARNTQSRDAWLEELSQQLARIQLDKSRGRIDESTHHDDESEDHDHLLTWPEGTINRIVFVVSFPFLFAFNYTIPDPRKARWTNFYPLTLLMVVVWFYLLSDLFVFSSDKCGCIIGIPADWMGLTFGAIGTSLPNLFASMLVAKQGQGNMAVSNAFGSNVFNIFMALGIPWCVATIILNPGNAYAVPSDAIKSAVILLLAFLLLFIIVMIYSRMMLSKRIGSIFLVFYLVFIVYETLTSFNVIPSMQEMMAN